VSTGNWQALSFSPDGRLLAAGGADGKVWLWDVSGESPREQARLDGHTKAICSVAFTSDGRTLLSASEDGTTRVWDLHGAAPRERAVLRGHEEAVTAVAVLPDGQTLVTGSQDQSLRLWDLGGETPHEKEPGAGQTMVVQSMAFADDRTLVLGCKDKTVRLWDLGWPTPRERRVVTGLTDIAWRVALSPDGKTLAVSHADRTVGLLDLSEDPTRERVLQQAPAVEKKEPPKSGLEAALAVVDASPEFVAPGLLFSPDGKTLLTDGPELRLWDLSGPRPVQMDFPPHHKGWGGQMTFSPDGRMLAVSDKEGALLWDLHGAQPRDLDMLDMRGWPAALSFSPDGQALLSLKLKADGEFVEEWGLKIRRLDREVRLEGKVREWVPLPAPFTPFAPDGKTVAYRSDLSDPEWKMTIYVRSVATGKKICDYQLPGSGIRVGVPFAFAPDGRHLAVNNDNGTVYILRFPDAPE
jgi:WD40 repeat protein